MASTLPPGELFALDTLVTATAQGIASRVLARTAAGNITLFAFDADEELSEHTAPFDALVITLSGALVLTIGGRDVQATPQSVVLMPANVPHAVRATEPSRMLLIMLREREQERGEDLQRIRSVSGSIRTRMRRRASTPPRSRQRGAADADARRPLATDPMRSCAAVGPSVSALGPSGRAKGPTSPAV